GNNFDWFRQDTKPGLLNLNLIIDEEVFLGLVGMDSSDSYQQAVLNGGQTDFQLNLAPLAPLAVPQIGTSLDVNGNPLTGYFMPPTGAFTATPPNAARAWPRGTGTSAMKACFADFLRLRNGGGATNRLYGLAAGAPTDRPFHSLSYPDINYTV